MRLERAPLGDRASARCGAERRAVTHDPVITLQRQAGNAAVNQLLRAPAIAGDFEVADTEARTQQYAALPETERQAIDQEAARRTGTRDEVMHDRNRLDSLPAEIRAIVMPGDRRPDPAGYGQALRVGDKLGKFSWEDWALFQRRVLANGGLRPSEPTIDAFTRERARERDTVERISGTERLYSLVVRFNVARHELGLTPDRYHRFPGYQEMQAELADNGFNGLADYENALSRYYLLFERRAGEIALEALSVSQRVVETEIARYNDERVVRALFGELAPLRTMLAENGNGAGAGSRAPTRLDDAQDERRRLAERYPSLADPELDIQDLGADTPEALGVALRANARTRLTNIGDTQGRVRAEPRRVLQLDRVRDLTRMELGAEDGTVGWRIVQSHLDEVANLERFKGEALGLLAIGLGMLTFGSGTLVVLGTAGEFGMGVYQAADEWDRYQAARAAAHSSLDPTQSLSSEDPTTFWFALALVGVGLSGLQLNKALRAAKGPIEVLERTGDASAFREALKQAKELTPGVRLAMDQARAAREGFKDALRALWRAVQAAASRPNMAVDMSIILRAIPALARQAGRIGIREFDLFMKTLKAQREVFAMLPELTAAQRKEWKRAFHQGLREYDATRPMIRVPFKKGERLVSFGDEMLLDGKPISEQDHKKVMELLDLGHTYKGHGAGRDARTLAAEAFADAEKGGDGMISQWASDETMFVQLERTRAEAMAGKAVRQKNGEYVVELAATPDVGRVYVANSKLPGSAAVRNRAPFARLEVSEIAPTHVLAAFKLKGGEYEITSIYPTYKP